MSQRPLVLATLGVLIITVAQGCSFPGSNLLQPAPVNYGILRLNTTSNRYDGLNTIEGGGDLSKTSITRFTQFGKETLFAVTSTGSIYNYNAAGQSWRTLQVADKAVVEGLEYANTGVDKLAISGSQNGVAKIYLSTESKALEQVYSDVTGGTSVPFLWMSKQDNSKLWAVVRSKDGDQAIASSDSGATWQKDIKLTNQAYSLSDVGGKLTLLLNNNQSLIQNNSRGLLPTFDLVATANDIGNQKVIKTVVDNGTTFYLTSNAFYRQSIEGTLSKLTLPITDTPLLDFAINPNNGSEYLVSVGKNLLQTTNAGGTWTIRNDVGNDQNAGRVLAVHYDKETKDQVYLGRGK